MRTLLCIAIIVFAGFPASTTAQARDLIESQTEFMQKVAGKLISGNGNTWLVAMPDGKLTGKYRGTNLTGTWQWQDKFWCRKGRVGILPLPFECQKVTLNDNTLVLTRKKGTGASFTYQIQ